MSPRFASMTNPVACAVLFHSVSKARVLSIWMVTTPVAILSSVWAQFAGLFGMPGALGGGTAGAVNAGVTENASKNANSKMRDMPILGLNTIQCLWIGQGQAPAGSCQAAVPFQT